MRGPIPRWDPVTRELWFDGVLVKRFRQKSPNQTLVLAVFQEDGWPPTIDDPIPGGADGGAPERLRRRPTTSTAASGSSTSAPMAAATGSFGDACRRTCTRKSRHADCERHRRPRAEWCQVNLFVATCRVRATHPPQDAVNATAGPVPAGR